MSKILTDEDGNRYELSDKVLEDNVYGLRPIPKSSLPTRDPCTVFYYFDESLAVNTINSDSYYGDSTYEVKNAFKTEEETTAVVAVIKALLEFVHQPYGKGDELSATKLAVYINEARSLVQREDNE